MNIIFNKTYRIQIVIDKLYYNSGDLVDINCILISNIQKSIISKITSGLNEMISLNIDDKLITKCKSIMKAFRLPTNINPSVNEDSFNLKLLNMY